MALPVATTGLLNMAEKIRPKHEAVSCGDKKAVLPC